MEFLHSIEPPICHRDLRSPNIFLSSVFYSSSVNAKVGDFGLARREVLNVSGLLKTWQWLGPEVINPKSTTYDKSSDVYSFAVVCWEIASRDHPFDEYHEIPEGVIVQKIIEEDLRPTIPPHTPKMFAELIHLCWAGNSKSRPSFSQIVISLEEMLEHIQDSESESIFPRIRSR
jgi:serine/threonine protein kinase